VRVARDGGAQVWVVSLVDSRQSQLAQLGRVSELFQIRQTDCGTDVSSNAQRVYCRQPADPFGRNDTTVISEASVCGTEVIAHQVLLRENRL
jgi:hypothetical protein